MQYQCLLGYLLCVPVAVAAYVIGTLRDQGKIVLLERKLSESTADRQLLMDKLDALNKSCTAITSNAHQQDSRIAEQDIAYAKLFKDCEEYKRQVSELRLKESPVSTKAKTRKTK